MLAPVIRLRRNFWLWAAGMIWSGIYGLLGCQAFRSKWFFWPLLAVWFVLWAAAVCLACRAAMQGRAGRLTRRIARDWLFILIPALGLVKIGWPIVLMVTRRYEWFGAVYLALGTVIAGVFCCRFAARLGDDPEQRTLLCERLTHKQQK